MKACIRAIEYFLPDDVLTNKNLANEFPDWSVDKIGAKTGIESRHIAAKDECASDLAVRAARKLFDSGVCSPGDIDYLLFCTQSPDYFLPTTACLIQQRLGIPITAGALDYNLGCSGFVAGLGLAKGLLETGQAKKLLLLTADTYSKHIDPTDRSVRTIFGDAGAATLIDLAPACIDDPIGPFVYGTDGSGAPNLIVRAGGMREPAIPNETGTRRDRLYMNGAEVFNFTLQAVPNCVQTLLDNAARTLDDIDLFVFHQANAYMLEHLRKRIGIPAEKFYLTMRDCGNTVSSTIPIALKHASLEGRLMPGSQVMLVGFGVGYSWAATLVRWQ